MSEITKNNVLKSLFICREMEEMREKLLSSRKRILDNVTSMQKEEQARLEAIRREKEARLEAIRLEEKKKEEMKNAWQTQQQGNWSVRSSSRKQLV